MLAAAALRFDVPTLALIAVGLAYLVSLVKDWRPIRNLRAENRELREALASADKKIAALEAKVVVLQNATDLTVLQTEHRQIAETLERVVDKLNSLDGAVRANTAATEMIARGSVLKQTLDDLEAK